MNIIDIIVLFLLAFGAILGFKRGFTQSLLSCVGLIVILFLSYFLKNPISKFFYLHFPFFKFGGFIKGVTVLNILVYEIIAFLIVFSVLIVIFKVLLLVSKIFETILKFTIILGIPSKLLGMVIGVIEYFVITFVFLYVISMPFFQIKAVQESKLREPILTKVPLLKGIIDQTVSVTEEFEDLLEKYKIEGSAEKFNLQTLNLFLKYKIISVDTVDLLVEKGKLMFDKAELENILKQYREVN